MNNESIDDVATTHLLEPGRKPSPLRRLKLVDVGDTSQAQAHHEAIARINMVNV